MANPLLTGVEARVPSRMPSWTSPKNSYQHFYDGSEIVVAGRLAEEDMNSFKAAVKATGVSWPRPSCALGVETYRRGSSLLHDVWPSRSSL